MFTRITPLAFGTFLTLLLGASGTHAQESGKEPANPNHMVSRKMAGAWTVSGWAKPDQSGFCEAARQIPTGSPNTPNLTFLIVKDGGQYALSLGSPAWELTPNSVFPISLSGGPALNSEGRAAAITSKIVQIGFGSDAAMVGRLASVTTLEVKTASTVFKLPFDGFAAALTELEACTTAVGRIATNPFAARPSQTLAAAPGLIEEPTFLTVRNGAKSYRLEALIVRSATAQGRLPIALVTHGKNRAFDMPNVRAEIMLPQARDFAYRGYLTVVVIRRGSGRSDGIPGTTASDPYVSCQKTDLHKAFDAEAEDLEAALRAIAERPDADASRSIAIGVSAGGGAVLGLAARQPKGLQAVINVSGGLRITGSDGTLCVPEEVSLAAMKAFGAATRVPTVWFYAENDSFFAADLVRGRAAAFAAGGGRAELHMFGPIAVDGHRLFSDPNGRNLWLAKLDTFLRTQGLPTWTPADVAAAMKAARAAGEKNRAFFEQYFSAFAGKVLVSSASGRHLNWSANTLNLETARENALAQCRKTSGEACHVLMENFELGSPSLKTATGAERKG